jgi:hypothetical protein
MSSRLCGLGGCRFNDLFNHSQPQTLTFAGEVALNGLQSAMQNAIRLQAVMLPRRRLCHAVLQAEGGSQVNWARVPYYNASTGKLVIDRARIPEGRREAYSLTARLHARDALGKSASLELVATVRPPTVALSGSPVAAQGTVQQQRQPVTGSWFADQYPPNGFAAVGRILGKTSVSQLNFFVQFCCCLKCLILSLCFSLSCAGYWIDGLHDGSRAELLTAVSQFDL